jgi:hypothetical protein
MPQDHPMTNPDVAEVAGRIVEVIRYTRAMIRANPKTLYVFGDNMARTGLGGQARECRGEPNAVGIPTKWRPTMDNAAFFRDSDLPKVTPRIQQAFRRLAAHLAEGGTVVWPSDGVGTGLARLPQCAPTIHAYINRCRNLHTQGA